MCFPGQSFLLPYIVGLVGRFFLGQQISALKQLNCQLYLFVHLLWETGKLTTTSLLRESSSYLVILYQMCMLFCHISYLGNVQRQVWAGLAQSVQ